MSGKIGAKHNQELSVTDVFDVSIMNTFKTMLIV